MERDGRSVARLRGLLPARGQSVSDETNLGSGSRRCRGNFCRRRAAESTQVDALNLNESAIEKHISDKQLVSSGLVATGNLGRQEFE